MIKKKVCCICGKKIKGYGNNPAPIKEKGSCCDECNLNTVIPVRTGLITVLRASCPKYKT